MKICMIGSGYVGLVTGTCFAEMGNDVTCVDKDAARVKRLKKGEIPFYEPGLSEVLLRNQKQRRLSFSVNLAQSVAGADVIFIAVGTPAQADGSSDISQIMAVAGEIGRGITGYCTIVNKSTAPVGTVERVQAIVRSELAKR